MNKTDTDLYKLIISAIEISGLTKRQFACKYGIGRAWLIFFLDPNTKPCKILPTTAYRVKSCTGIPQNYITEFNKQVPELIEEWEKTHGNEAV